jgi:hypothetical protein
VPPLSGGAAPSNVSIKCRGWYLRFHYLRHAEKDTCRCSVKRGRDCVRGKPEAAGKMAASHGRLGNKLRSHLERIG